MLKIGIKKITKSDTQYIMETTKDTEIRIEDFIDIRYDYIFGKMRMIYGNEYKEIKKYLDVLFGILKSVKDQNDLVKIVK